MRHLLSDTTWTATSHGVAAISVLLVQVMLARSVTPELFGQFLISQALVLLMEATLSARAGEVAMHWVGRSWGADFASARSYADYLARRELYWGGGGYLCVLLAAAIMGSWTQLSVVTTAVLALAIPLQSGYGVSKTVFIASGRLREQALFEIAYGLSLAGLTAVTVYFWDIWGYIASYLLVTAAKAWIASWVTRRFWPEGIAPVAVTHMRAGVSMHSLARNVCASITTQADVILLGLWGAGQAVAVYRVARTLSSLPGRVAAPLWAALRPRLLDALKRGDERRLHRLITMPALGFVVIGMVAAPVVAVYLERMITLLYGPSYGDSAPLTFILMAGTWWYQCITGWVGFAAIISERKMYGTILALTLAALVVISSIVAAGSPLRLAIGISVSMGLVGAAAWAMIFARNGSSRFFFR